LCELEVKFCDNRFKTLCRGHRVLGIYELTDTIEKPSKSDFGEKIPKVISANTLFLFLFEAARETDNFFELDDTWMWKVEFSEEVAFKQ
jgi:hypothetical protein